MPHGQLEWPDPATSLIVQSLLDGMVEAPRCEIGLDAGVDRLGMVRVESGVQWLQFAGVEGGDCALDLFDSAEAHVDLVSSLWRSRLGSPSCRILTKSVVSVASRQEIPA